MKFSKRFELICYYSKTNYTINLKLFPNVDNIILFGFEKNFKIYKW